MGEAVTPARPMEALVLVNPSSARYADAVDFLFPYLDHLGVPARVRDVRRPPRDPGNWPLIIVGHRGLRADAGLRRAVVAAVEAGCGLVTFDPDWPLPAHAGRRTAEGPVEIRGGRHWITRRHPPADRYMTGKPMILRPVAGRTPAGGRVLASAGGVPLVSAGRVGRGRVVRWATWDWASPAVLGPFAGLDDLVWRGFAWAARKPFAIRGLPPLVCMRVDDVAADGGLHDCSPLYWVRDSLQSGFRPWLGTFVYNLSPRAVGELRPWLSRGVVTESPHAFGRRPVGVSRRLHWAPDAVHLHGGRMDDFIYYDHYRARPWPDREAARRLQAAEGWYAARNLPRRDGVFIPHWYEAGSSVFPRLHDRWGIRFTSLAKPPEMPCVWRSPWLKGGPFRLRGPRGPGIPRSWRPDCVGKRPVYYADYSDLGGRRFFNSLTEIRDVAGYEWAPGNGVSPSVDRGVRILSRAIDSMGLAVLFTHEMDYIWKIRPAEWRGMIAGVARGIADRAPEFVTLEEGMRYIRAVRDSRFSACGLDARGRLVAEFRGHADVPTVFHLFTDAGAGVRTARVRIPPFRGRVRVSRPTAP